MLVRPVGGINDLIKIKVEEGVALYLAGRCVFKQYWLHR